MEASGDCVIFPSDVDENPARCLVHEIVMPFLTLQN